MLLMHLLCLPVDLDFHSYFVHYSANIFPNLKSYSLYLASLITTDNITILIFI